MRLLPPQIPMKVHRDQHGFPEDVEKEEVERHEDADHPRLQQEHGDGEFLPARLDGVPGREQGQRHEEGREQDQEEADAVDAEMVGDAERGHPGAVLDELIAGAGRVEAQVERHRREERRRGHAETRGLVQILPAARQEEDQEGPQRRQERDDGEEHR